MPSSLNRLIRTGIVVFALLPACSSGDAAQARTQGGRGGRGPGGGPQAVVVAVTPVERRSIARSVTLTAPVEPVRRVGVNSQMTGTVLRVAVQEGDRVAPGALMAELDTREVTAQMDRARATLANAETAFQRATAMHDQRIITDAEFEQARATFGAAKSDVALWETRLGFGRIVAPGAGMVTAKLVEAGSAVTPNQRMFELADESLFVVRVQVSELDVVHLAGGEDVAVLLDAYPDRPVPGRVRRVFPAADPQSRLVPVEVALGTPPAGVRIRPGFLARVRLDLEEIPNALAVPSSAIGAAPAGPFVFAVLGDTLAQRMVGTGLSADGWVQITSGLAEGEAVVVSGHANLRAGVKVRIAAAGPNASQDSAAGTP